MSEAANALYLDLFRRRMLGGPLGDGTSVAVVMMNAGTAGTGRTPTPAGTLNNSGLLERECEELAKECPRLAK